jgi:actin-like ATPase involved in cell morphogenesis
MPMPSELRKGAMEHPFILTGEYAAIPGLKEYLEQKLEHEFVIQEIDLNLKS